MSIQGILATSSRKWLSKTATSCAVLLLLAPAASLAQLAVTASANGQYEYNSNVFDLQHGFPTPFYGVNAVTGATVVGPRSYSYGDSMFAYGAKLDADYAISQQDFHVVLLGTEYRYDSFTLLNHSEYTLDGSWNLKFGSLVDGLVEVYRNRSMVSLYNLINAQLALQTEQRETVKLGLQATPDWRGEVGGYTRKVDSPLLGVPDLALTETSGEVAIKYTGAAGFTGGLQGGYLHGDFSGNEALVGGVLTNIAPSYRQWNLALTATDQVSGVSTFVGQIGYSKRTATADQAVVGASDSASGLTGELDYKRAVTGKTTVEAALSRAINTYITGTGSEFDTVALLDANWQATSKIGVLLGYSFYYRQYPDQGTAPNSYDVIAGLNRTDRQHFVNLNLDYEAASWLSVRPYVNYQIRRSTNFYGGDYDATVVGVKFSVQVQRGTPPPPQPFQIAPFQF